MQATVIQPSFAAYRQSSQRACVAAERWLYTYGCGCRTVSVMAQSREQLQAQLALAVQDSDIIVLLDYLSCPAKEAVCACLGINAVEDEGLRAQYAVGKKTKDTKALWVIPENAKRLPSGSELPELVLEHNGKRVFFLLETEPVAAFMLEGVCSEIPRKVFKLCGLTQFEVASGMSLLLRDVGRFASYYVYDNGGLDITLSVCLKPRKRRDPAYETVIEQTFSSVYRYFQSNLYAEEDVTLEETLIKLLRHYNYALGVAESLTGGLICDRIVSQPGASEVFYEGAVTYASHAKIHRLGVPEQIIRQKGAISNETADAMVRGLAASGVDIAIATTGLAGPMPDEGKPVGLTYIAVWHEGKTHVFKRQFAGSRSEVRLAAANAALFYAICSVTKRNLYTGLHIS